MLLMLPHLWNRYRIMFGDSRRVMQTFDPNRPCYPDFNATLVSTVSLWVNDLLIGGNKVNNSDASASAFRLVCSLQLKLCVKAVYNEVCRSRLAALTSELSCWLANTT